MHTLYKSLCLAAFAAAAAAGTARAADDRLLVVVEAAPGAGVDPSDIRRTIGMELGTPVVAPADAMAAGASNVLIVAVDKTEIRMSFRTSSVGQVARTIPTPLDRPARLREIGWLAGNLARDQVSGIFAPPVELPPGPNEPVVGAADVRPATEPPPLASPPSEPAATVAARPSEAAAQWPRWSITAVGGPTMDFRFRGAPLAGNSQPLIGSVAYQLEAQHQASPDGIIFGAALEVGSDREYGTEIFGFSAFVGSSWRHGRWLLETTVGVGLEAEQGSSYTLTNSSNEGPSSSVTSAVEPALFLRGVGTVGLSITRSLDLVGRLGVHLASGGDWDADFLTPAVGLRYALP